MADLDGVYRIKNVSTGTCMNLPTVMGSLRCSTVGTQGKKELWRVLPQAGLRGHYKLQNLEFGVELAWNTPGVVMAGLQNGHVWMIEEVANKQFIIHQGMDSLVIDLESTADKHGNTTAIMGIAWGNANTSHKWVFETAKDLGQGKVPTSYLGPRPAHPCYPVPPGKYVIKNVMTGTVLHFEPGSGGANGRVYGHQADGSKNQQWVVRATRTGTNMYIYSEVDPKKNHGITYPKFEHGAILEPSAVNDWFGYTIFPADKGFYISPVQLPLHMVDLAKGEEDDKTDVLLWNLNKEDNQKWYFESA